MRRAVAAIFTVLIFFTLSVNMVQAEEAASEQTMHEITAPDRLGGERKWTISYNAALSTHEAAMPKKFKVGSKYKITYRQESVVVRAVYGGCTCLDISDEAMNILASTSKGVIRATVTPR